MHIDIVLEDDRWSDLDLSGLADRAAASLAQHLDLPNDLEAVIMGCDDTRIAELNTEFRDKPTPTNVLSWPFIDLSPQAEGAMPKAPVAEELGDIAISFDTCTREARQQGIAVQDHVTHLVVHGLLHLLGYDHVRDGDATVMEGLESAILGKLGVDDPYKEDDRA